MKILNVVVSQSNTEQIWWTLNSIMSPSRTKRAIDHKSNLPSSQKSVAILCSLLFDTYILSEKSMPIEKLSQCRCHHRIQLIIIWKSDRPTIDLGVMRSSIDFDVSISLISRIIQHTTLWISPKFTGACFWTPVTKVGQFPPSWHFPLALSWKQGIGIVVTGSWSNSFSKQILIRSFLVIEDDDVAKFFEFSKNSFGCSWAAWSSKTLPQMFISLRVFRGTPESRLDFLLELELIRRCLGTWDCPELSQSRDHEILGRLTRNSLHSAILRLSQELWLTIFRSLFCCMEHSSNLFCVNLCCFFKAASS